MSKHRAKADSVQLLTDGLREIRLVLPDARLDAVRRRIAEQVARLDASDEREAIDWIEAVSESP